MDRGARRIQKARIRARLRQTLVEQIRDAQQAALSRNGREVTPARIAEMRRSLYRNEGKPYGQWSPYLFWRCDCGYCTDSRRYRTNREAERMEQDRRGWWKFGVGEGEE